ncbi:aspartyl protease family protein [Stenotrophomonas panacihumi]|uniref:aspartyl protease family protein n=2 Tax=Stenotrophomonas panacihumi TaxID=676599 RepID=UPI001929DFCE|nr:aspartyl protease family protein [Stenotrophomonas panacihumi]
MPEFKDVPMRQSIDRHAPSRRWTLRALLSLFACAIAPTGSAAPSNEPAQLSACAPTRLQGEDTIVHVPFQVVDGRIYVDARVNGMGPFRFAVDTGAGGMARADTRLVDTLGLQVVGQASVSDGVQHADVETTRLASVQLGGLVRSDVEAITRDYASRAPEEAKFHGLLVREFFSDGVLVIDYPNRMLSFSRTMTLSPKDPDSLRYERAFRVPISIGAVHALGNLDTGANVSIVLPQALYAAVESGPAESGGRAQLTNGHIDLQRATIKGPVQIGTLSLSNLEAKVSEKYPEILVGAHALQDAVILIDQRSKVVAVCGRGQ